MRFLGYVSRQTDTHTQTDRQLIAIYRQQQLGVTENVQVC